MRTHRLLLLSAVACWSSLCGAADDVPAVKKEEKFYDRSDQFDKLTPDRIVPLVKTKTVLDGLDNPCGLAIQPGPGNLYISESGAGRILRITVTGHEPVITDFPTDLYGPGPKYKIGPLGLTFITRNLLAVGGGGLPLGEEVIGIYQVPVPGKTLKAKDTKLRIGPWSAGSSSAQGEGKFFSIATDNSENIFFTSRGDESKAWVGRIDLTINKSGTLVPWLATKEATGVGGASAVAISPRGELVLAQSGSYDKPRDSLVSFFDPETKKLLLKLDTGLNDISALAYSPRTGWLYAADFSWADPKQGGLFRLDRVLVDGQQKVKAVRVATLDKPTALAFAPNGALYITLFGTEAKTGAKEAKEKPGSLIRITGKL